jgi:beta-glucosidase
VPLYYGARPTHRPGSVWEKRGWYKDTLNTPLYPFGFGLGYTTFEYRDLAVSPARAAMTGAVEVSVTVVNTGAHPGSEVVQLYVRDLKASVPRPVKELKGFQKVTLEPGQSQRVTFTLGAADLTFTGLDYRPTAEPGEFRVWVGPDSDHGLEAGFGLVG